MAYYVIADAEGAPWPLSLDGYPTKTRAVAAVAWQLRGAGGFDPPGYWRVVAEADLDKGSLHQGPYTQAAWDAFLKGHPSPRVTPAGR